MNNPWPNSWLKRIIFGLYSLPYTIFGPALLLAIYIITLGNISIRINPGVIEVIVKGWLGEKFYRKGWAAFTCGWTIFFWTMNSFTLRVRKHERTHTKQSLKYSIIFPILYIYYLVIYGYWNNRFEVLARKEESVILDFSRME